MHMRNRFIFTIRFKILITLLLVITAAVTIITFTMANLFHTDKTAYIHDLTSVMALNTAAETRSLLDGYRERLQVFTRFMLDEDLSKTQKTKLLKQLFEDFEELMSVTLYKNGTELGTVLDAETLEDAGLTKDNLSKFRQGNPLPLDQIQTGEIFVENSTLSEKFPTLTLAIPHPSPDSGKDIVAVAMIRLDRLLHLAKRSQVFETFIVDSRGHLLAHPDRQKVALHTRVDWIPEIKSLQGQQSLGTTLEYDQGKVAMIGGFSRVELSGLLTGVQIPKTAAYLTARELLNNLLGVSLALLALSAALSLFWSRRITKPIERLSNAAQVMGTGQFDIQVESSSRDEIGDLSNSFNLMASELNIRERALKEAQGALIQSEKMSAFGQLGAGIAHEVKNPLAGILGLAQLSLRKIEKETPLHKNLLLIEKEAKRCKAIIENLMKFARQEQVAYERIEINRVVEDTVAIVDHQLSINQVKLQEELNPDLPHIEGNANQIQQVLMNLIINAQQAMEGEPGSVTVTTRNPEPEQIEIRISDTGPGIAKELQAKIFEPFFTSKAVGKGTGLGLSVSYGIIQDHNGEIRVESVPGMGTTFIITLPQAGSAAPSGSSDAPRSAQS